jgi:hypothetical protein
MPASASTRRACFWLESIRKSLDIGYRYRAVNKFDFTAVDGSSSGFKSNAVLIGLRKQF